jgi:hypothetical protein
MTFVHLFVIFANEAEFFIDNTVVGGSLHKYRAVYGCLSEGLNEVNLTAIDIVE